MAQVRRPVPFRTRKLRPGTAMVLHPTGCGRVARRRTTRTGSPSEHTPQGAFPISETLTTQTHTPPQKHPGLLALMRPTSGTIPGRPRRRGRRETARPRPWEPDARAPHTRETTTDLCYDAWIESATLNVLMPFSRWSCQGKQYDNCIATRRLIGARLASI